MLVSMYFLSIYVWYTLILCTDVFVSSSLTLSCFANFTVNLIVLNIQKKTQIRLLTSQSLCVWGEGVLVLVLVLVVVVQKCGELLSEIFGFRSPLHIFIWTYSSHICCPSTAQSDCSPSGFSLVQPLSQNRALESLFRGFTGTRFLQPQKSPRGSSPLHSPNTRVC